MKAIKIISTVIFLLLCFACEKDSHYIINDKEFEEQKVEEINGDSFLKVSSEVNQETRVYFNGKFIGVVGVGCCRTWDVPVGTHTIRLYNNHNSACCAELEFKEGIATCICSKQNMEQDSIFRYEDEYIR